MNKLIAILLLSTVTCFGGSKFVRGKFVSGAMPYLYVPLPLPIVNFAGYPTAIDVGSSVGFTSLSQYGLTYKWLFGDGSTSTSQNPTYFYNTTGTFNVTLNVTNLTGGASLTKTNYITVNPTIAYGLQNYWSFDSTWNNPSLFYYADYGIYEMNVALPQYSGSGGFSAQEDDQWNGKCALFDIINPSENSSLYTTSSPIPTTPFTLNFWANNQYFNGTSSAGYLSLCNGDLRVYYNGYDSGYDVWFIAFSSYASGYLGDLSNNYYGSWDMITVVFDGTNTLFYVNGTLIYTGAGAAVNNSGDIILGSDTVSSGDSLHAYFDDVAVWTRALSQSEILTIFNNGNKLGTLL